MTLKTTLVDVVDISAAPIPGYPSWPVAALPFESDIATVYPADMVAYVQPKRGGLEASPLRERDACSDTRIWTAQTTGTTAVEDSDQLGGLPRWSFNGVDNGIYGSIDAPLTDYSFALLARTTSVIGIKALLNIGTTSGTRLFFYITADDLALQHGTGDIKTSTGSTLAANTWMPLIVSYKNSDKSLRVYAGSTTPLITATMTNSPPSDLLGAIGSLRAGGQPMAGEIALSAIWARALHDDTAAIAKLMTALKGLAALT